MLLSFFSPFFSPECKEFKNLADARACDAKVEAYCNALAVKGESDPGCIGYVKKEYLFGVPRVASNCTYRFHEFELNGKMFKKQEVAIIDCEFVDLTGKRPDTTPVFWHVDPLTGIPGQTPSADLATIRTGLQTLQNQRGWVLYCLWWRGVGEPQLRMMRDEHEMKKYAHSRHTTVERAPPTELISIVHRTGGMRKLTDMVLEDYYPFLDPALKSNNGNLRDAFDGNGHLLWGNLIKDDPRYVHNHLGSAGAPGGERSCNYKQDRRTFQRHDVNGIPITPLPPCEDPTGWAAKAIAMELKWRGVNKHSWIDSVEYEHIVRDLLRKYPDTHSMYEELKDLDPSKFNTSCIPRPGHFVAMIPVSKTVSSRACHGEGCTFKNAWDENAPETTEVFPEYLVDPNGFNSNPECTPINAHKFANQNLVKNYDAWCCREQNKSPHCQNKGNVAECCPSINANYVPMTVKDAIKGGQVGRTEKVMSANREGGRNQDSLSMRVCSSLFPQTRQLSSLATDCFSRDVLMATAYMPLSRARRSDSLRQPPSLTCVRWRMRRTPSARERRNSTALSRFPTSRKTSLRSALLRRGRDTAMPWNSLRDLRS